MLDPRLGQMEAALRQRLELAGCYFLRDESVAPGAEVWFSPHLNREFNVPERVTNREAANSVLRDAGMEEAF